MDQLVNRLGFGLGEAMVPSLFGPDGLAGLAGASNLRSLVPSSIRVDVAESDTAYTVKADVPGADKDALKVRGETAVQPV